MQSKILGTSLLIAGTAIGAGMLALPLIAGLAGFSCALVILIGIWALMTYTGLLILEVNLSLPVRKNSFSSMAKATAGPFAGIAAWVCVLLLLYSLTGAYISGDTSLLSLLFHMLFHLTLPNWILSILFTAIFGGIVVHSTRATDQTNRLFITLKLFFLTTTMALLLPRIHLPLLTARPHDLNTLWLIAPIFLTSFGYHTVIPSLTNYIGKQPALLKKSIIIGTTLPLITYILWLFTTLGSIPQTGPHGFLTLSKHHSIATLSHYLMQLNHNPWISISISCFTNIAVVTSFLGVTLGLFDFLADVTHGKNTRLGRFKTAGLTFIPPLVFSLIYPGGFIIALSMAAVFVAFLEVILPAWMCYQARKNQTNPIYQVAGGNISLFIVGAIGLLLIFSTLVKFL